MSSIIQPQLIRDLYRNDFGCFSERSFLELNPGAVFLPNWHIDMMVSKLEAFFRRDIQFLIINILPRSLKSHLASVALPAFWLGHRPSAKFICASYGQELADALSRARRNLMLSRVYQETFPTRLQRGHQSLGEFSTTRGGYCIATSVGGALTGRGADVLVLDDILKPGEALSAALRKAVIEWYKNTLLSRLNSQVTGQILVIMQRLHAEDITGYLMEQNAGFELLSLPAIAEVDETHQIVTPLSTYTHVRKQGEALHPAHLPLERLEEIRRTIGTYNFAGQYQQRPAPLGGGVVNIDWMPSYMPGELPEEFQFVVQSWDCANTISDEASYSVCITFGVTAKRKIYVLNIFRRRLEYPDLKRAVRSQAEAHKPNTILIEDKAAGTQLIQDFKREDLHTVVGVKPMADKRARLLAQTPAIENGQVLIPRECHWRAEFLEELALFPNGVHDDQVDSFSQGLKWIAENSHEPGMLTYYKMLVQKRRDEEQAMREANEEEEDA